MKRRWLLVSVFAALAGAVLPWPTSNPVSAQAATTTLKIVTLAPANSSWFRVFNAWNQSLREATHGAVQLEFVSKGRTADERDFVTGMQSGQYDGAVLTANGLGVAAPATLALGLPGLITDYDKLDRVRQRLGADFERAFETAPNGGYQLLGWADVGKARLFSSQPLSRPSALSGRGFWASHDDVIAAALAQAGSANRREIPLSGVSRALEGGQVDTVYGSALAAVSMNWHSRLTHVSRDPVGIVIGATVLKKAAFDRVPEAHRAALRDTATRAHAALARTIRRDDDRNLETALARGVTADDLTPARAEWDAYFARVRQALVGRTVPAALATKVEQAAH